MKIAVLLSGGVDSSVALALLKEQGHDLTAFYLKIWLEDEVAFLGECPWEDDLSQVRAVCGQLGVPLRIVSLQKEYWEQVVSYTLQEVKAGRTPNPDVLCNQRIKFGLFFDHIDTSFEKVATGHYAQIAESHGTYILKQSPDPIKDQTYFLATLSQSQLGRALFPIGHLTKAEVRAVAQRYNLVNAGRKDSQGICFLGKLKFTDFIKHYMGEQPGDIVEYETGSILGSHRGFWYYTIGQRQGLGLAGGPWYVVAKDTTNNQVFVSRAYYDEHKKRDTFLVDIVTWVPNVRPITSAQVKIRHGSQLHDARLEHEHEKRVSVYLAQRDQGIAPGQFAVFYDDTLCVGSGIIVHEIPGVSLRK
jgi:tRNA-5-taurinomethyluridine 2-sulfurtransferase